MIPRLSTLPLLDMTRDQPFRVSPPPQLCRFRRLSARECYRPIIGEAPDQIAVTCCLTQRGCLSMALCVLPALALGGKPGRWPVRHQHAALPAVTLWAML